jgi:peptidoglycan-N-acetylglucosamine deacetylase
MCAWAFYERGDSVSAATRAGEEKPRATVCLSVDFDAVSVWMQWGATGPKALSRGEFGATVGAPRLLDLLDRLGVSSTWFIPGHTADTWPVVTAQVAERGHEIANHGYLHESFESRTLDECRSIIRKGSDVLARLTGRRPKGFRLPIGDAPPDLFELLVEEGFVYDSSLCGDDFHLYRCRKADRVVRDGPNIFGEPLDLVEVPWSFIMNDFHHFEFSYANPTLPGHDSSSSVEEEFKAQFDYMHSSVPGGVVTLIVHPQSIGHGSRIAMLERFITYCLSKKGTRFATMDQVVSEHLASQPRA